MDARKPLRLRRFDYASPGLYFVTACAARRGDLFGKVADARVWLNPIGRIVEGQLAGVSERSAGASIDTSIVMPDHIHALVVLDGSRRLGAIVAAFKAGSSREAGAALWQRGYYDHVVRAEDDLDLIRTYIVTNPLRWWLKRASRGSPLHNQDHPIQ